MFGWSHKKTGKGKVTKSSTHQTNVVVLLGPYNRIAFKACKSVVGEFLFSEVQLTFPVEDGDYIKHYGLIQEVMQHVKKKYFFLPTVFKIYLARYCGKVVRHRKLKCFSV